MNKKTLLSILIILLVTVGVRYVLLRKDTTPTTSISGATVTEAGDYSYTYETEFIRIEATYPAKTALSGGADLRARQTMEDWILSREQSFVDLVAEFLDEDEMNRLRESGRKYAMGIEYVAHAGVDTNSYVYQIYEDTHGAHPNVYYKTFVFNTDGVSLALADLFVPTADYLSILSEKATTRVVRMMQERLGEPVDEYMLEWIEEGTSSTQEALQFFYIDGSDLVFIFPPYQVAPYALGVFEARIPASELEGMLVVY